MSRIRGRIKRSSNFEWDCIAMPSGTSVGGGNYSRLSTLMLGISQRTEHSRLAWELLKTIACTEEMQTMVYTELSGVSALHSVTESDEVAQLLQLDSQDTASRRNVYSCLPSWRIRLPRPALRGIIRRWRAPTA